MVKHPVNNTFSNYFPQNSHERDRLTNEKLPSTDRYRQSNVLTYTNSRHTAIGNDKNEV